MNSILKRVNIILETGLEIGKVYRLVNIQDNQLSFEEVQVAPELLRVQLHGIIDYAIFKIDVDKRRVFNVEGKWEHLTATEWRLLEMFLMQPDKTISSKVILQNVWGAEYWDDDQVLRVWVSRLRVKIEGEQRARIVGKRRGESSDSVIRNMSRAYMFDTSWRPQVVDTAEYGLAQAIYAQENETDD